MKRAFKVKLKAFSIIFKELSVERKARKENMRIFYECLIMANELHRYFPY